MTPAAATHPRLSELLSTSQRRRWPYTPVQAWADRAGAAQASPPAADSAPAVPAGWQTGLLENDAGELVLQGTIRHALRIIELVADWNQRGATIQVASGADATLFLELGNTGSGVLDLNIDIQLAANSQLRLIRIAELAPQGTAFESWQLGLAEGATLHCTDLNLGAGRNHVDTRIALQAPGASAEWHSLSILQGDTRAVNQLRVEHQATQTRSRLEARNVLADRARRSLIGMIKVDRGAAGTDSAQMCRSLLLSQGAGADMRPELEIYNDAVQCAHGATCGALDEDALHYLRTRGLDRNTARGLLLDGFCQPMLASLPPGLSEAWSQRAHEKLRQIGTSEQ